MIWQPEFTDKTLSRKTGAVQFTKALSVVLLTCALFSGQLMAGHKGHEFVWVKNVDHQLRHEADSDELRAVAEESAEGLREHFYWQKSRKPEAGQR
ncbi:YncJ family protein [Escherichia coli]|nr:YncJ family protein [Escherichia coli]